MADELKLPGTVWVTVDENDGDTHCTADKDNADYWRTFGFPVFEYRRTAAPVSAPSGAVDSEASRALEWYAQQVSDCRKITKDGDTARYALDADGGERARAALAGLPCEGAAVDMPAQMGGNDGPMTPEHVRRFKEAFGKNGATIVPADPPRPAAQASDAEDGTRYRAIWDAAVWGNASFLDVLEASFPADVRLGRRYPTTDEWDSAIDVAIAAQRENGNG